MNITEFGKGFIHGFTIIPRFYEDVPYLQDEMTSYKAGTILGGLSIGALTFYLASKILTPHVQSHEIISNQSGIFFGTYEAPDFINNVFGIPILTTSVIMICESIINALASTGNIEIEYNCSNEQNIAVSGEINDYAII